MDVLFKNELTVQEMYDFALVADRKGEFQKAVTLYQSILQQYPQNAEVLSLFGELAFTTRNFEVAFQLMRQAIEVAPFEILYYLSLARMFIYVQDFKNGIKVYEELIAKNIKLCECQENMKHDFWGHGGCRNRKKNNIALTKSEADFINKLKAMNEKIDICSNKIKSCEYDIELNNIINIIIEKYLDITQNEIFMSYQDMNLLTDKLSDGLVKVVELINDDNIQDLSERFLAVKIVYEIWYDKLDGRLNA